MKRIVYAGLFFAALIALWQGLFAAGFWSPVLLPSPADVGAYLVRSVADGSLPTAMVVTLRRLLLGYALGLGLALPLGILVARFQLIRDTIGVVALGFQTLPSVCWIPLALLWFGQTEGAMTFVVVMGTIWSITLATNHGLRSVPPVYARAARTMGSRGLHTWVFVTVPAALPFITTGMKQGWAFAWRSLMGRGDLRDHPHRFRPGPPAPLRPGAPRHGPGAGRDAGDRAGGGGGGQGALLARGAFSAPTLGDRHMIARRTDVVLRIQQGLHALPCSQLARLASRFQSRIVLRTAARQADARSILELLALMGRGGEPARRGGAGVRRRGSTRCGLGLSLGARSRRIRSERSGAYWPGCNRSGR